MNLYSELSFVRDLSMPMVKLYMGINVIREVNKIRGGGGRGVISEMEKSIPKRYM